MQKQDVVLSQRGPRDAAVNFDTEFYNGIVLFLRHSTHFSASGDSVYYEYVHNVHLYNAN